MNVTMRMDAPEGSGTIISSTVRDAEPALVGCDVNHHAAHPVEQNHPFVAD